MINPPPNSKTELSLSGRQASVTPATVNVAVAPVNSAFTRTVQRLTFTSTGPCAGMFEYRPEKEGIKTLQYQQRALL